MRIRARLLSPVSESELRYLPDAVVEIGPDGKFTAVGPYDGGLVDEDLRPGVLVPGFVDAHVHFPQTRIVGAASGPLLQWLERSTFPEEQRYADPDHAARMADVFTRCLAAAGTTTAMVYSSVHAGACDALFAALDRTGLRALAGPVLMDAHSPPELTVGVDQAMAGLDALRERWHRPEGRLQLAVIPRFALSCSRQMLDAAGAYSREHDLWVTTHLAETEAECRIAVERFGTRDYTEVYESAGLVHERSVYAHCIYLSESELDRLAAARAVFAHCPDSNDFLGSGGMPVDAVRERGIPVAIGTDIAAGRSFRIPHILSAAYDNGLRQGSSVDPATLLWWGTRGGAAALGFDDVGAIEPGWRADLVCLDLPDWVESLDDVLAWTLFDGDAPRPLRTWVDGQLVWDRSAAAQGYPW